MATTPFKNTAVADGIVNSLPTDLTGIVTIHLVNGLTMTKSADKQSWANGELTYTLEIDNTLGTEDYTGITVSDVLDPAVVVLVTDSVEKDGVIQDYTYNDTSGLLTIPQTGSFDVDAGEKTTITFRCTKKV